MRWRLTLALSAFLVLVFVANANAQDPHVTVTLEPKKGGHPVVAVQFPDIGDGQWKYQDANERIQHYLGQITGDPVEGRYVVKVNMQVGKSIHDYTFSFREDDFCGPPEPTPPNEGKVARISCATPKHGAGLICTAMYDLALDPPKDKPCKGTQACMNCGGIKVCGSDPGCD